LLEHNAFPYVPDKGGRFPIDLAGWKDHDSSALILIEKLIDTIVELFSHGIVKNEAELHKHAIYKKNRFTLNQICQQLL
jgi:hypothetical protein